MIYQATILRLDDSIEEEVLLRIGNLELICFASVCPYVIKSGLSYSVKLHPVVFGNYEITKQPDETQMTISHVGNSYAYDVIGTLKGNCLESCGIVLKDDVLLRDFSYLDQKVVLMKIDRLDVEFV